MIYNEWCNEWHGEHVARRDEPVKTTAAKHGDEWYCVGRDIATIGVQGRYWSYRKNGGNFCSSLSCGFHFFSSDKSTFVPNLIILKSVPGPPVCRQWISYSFAHKRLRARTCVHSSLVPVWKQWFPYCIATKTLKKGSLFVPGPPVWRQRIPLSYR